jgi:DNA-binding transcriptional LysR family regulator
VFDAIFREGNIVRAAQRLGMSQPAASHALARLRHALSDDLFVRSAQGMLPTARAEQLAEPIRQALAYLELGLQSGPFEAQSSTYKFKVALDNCSAVSLTPRIVTAIALVAPDISLELRPSGTMEIDRMIDAGEIDLFIGRPGENRERFASDELSSDDFVVVHGKRFDRDASMTVEELIDIPHLHLSSVGDDMSFVDIWLAERGLQRRVKHSVPLLGCTAVLQQQNVCAVMRRPIAEVICRTSGLIASELPFRSPCISTRMRWHKRLDSQPAHMWLRQIVRNCHRVDQEN